MTVKITIEVEDGSDENVFAVVREWLNEVYGEGYDDGYDDSYDEGFIDGREKAINEFMGNPCDGKCICCWMREDCCCAYCEEDCSKCKANDDLKKKKAKDSPNSE